MSRKTFQRLPEDARRLELLEATLACIGEDGLNGASARKIAERAGVTAGLIRHYFGSKEEMLRAAYAHLMTQLTGQAEAVAQTRALTPAQSLAGFISANLMRPNLSARKVSLWSTFIGRVEHEPGYSQIHRASYQEFLDLLATLIRDARHACDLPHDAPLCHDLAIALNGLIDGLWIEGSLDHGIYDPERLPLIALQAAEGLLHLPKDSLTQHQIAS
ncbi:TetR family transcriptional regulator C-terminal domain-containing protein [Thioclava sp. GXIMD4216]|uniref:TetR family transcriptional regulator C-terminal domain-containing protein n=1 Tax=Thioclava sp. GXIMD4216 TaxID=3131929 RepID=UPI0030CB1172